MWIVPLIIAKDGLTGRHYSTNQINEIYDQFINENKNRIKEAQIDKRNTHERFKKRRLSIKNLDKNKRRTGITNFKNLPSPHVSPNSSQHEISSLRENSSFQPQANQDKDEDNEQLSVGFQLFSLNLSRVLMIAIFLLITIPIFTSETYFKMLTSYQSGLTCLGNLINKEGGISTDFDNLIAYYQDSFDREAGGNRKIIYLKVVQVTSTISEITDFTNSSTKVIKSYGIEADLEDQRPYAIKSFSSLTSFENVPKDTFYLVVFINNNYDENIDAVLGIFRTIFVLLVFGMLTYFFRRDTIKLLVQPMGKMKRTIRLVKKYPIRATNYIDLEFLTEYFEIQKYSFRFLKLLGLSVTLGIISKKSHTKNNNVTKQPHW